MLCVCVGGGGDRLTPATAFLCLKNMTDIHTNTQRIMADVTVEAQLRVQQENRKMSSIFTQAGSHGSPPRFGQKEVSFPLPDSLKRDGQVDNFSTALKESMSLFHL